MRVARRCLVGGPSGKHEDGHAVVVISAPPASDVECTTPGDHGAGRHHLVEHLGVHSGVGPVSPGAQPTIGEPGVQRLTADAETVRRVVARGCDHPVN